MPVYFIYSEKKMEKSAKSSNLIRILSLICPFVYFASYVSRKNYGVVISDVILSEGISNSVAAITSTATLIAYGVGQIISGVLCDRYKPQNIIYIGLISSAACNMLFPFIPDPYVRAIVWMFNGFAQSMLWPPLVKILADCADEKNYNKICANTNIAATVGTVFLYLTSSLIWVKFFSWKLTFISSAVIALMAAVLWRVNTKKLDFTGDNDKTEEKKKPEAPSVKKVLCLIVSSGLLAALFVVVFQGALKDGITDWIPVLSVETFNIGSDSAILDAVLMPILAIVGLELAKIVYDKWIKNEMVGAIAAFIPTLIAVIILFFVYDFNRFLTVGLCALVCMCMHIVNYYLVCIIPVRFKKYGLAGTFSGLINAFTYIGTAGAAYFFGLISEKAGWSACILSWIAISVLSMLLCLVAMLKWNKFIKD